MEPVEKKKNDFDYVDWFLSILLGVFLGWMWADQPRLPLSVPVMVSGVFSLLAVHLLLSRLFRPPGKSFLGLCAGLAIMGFWQMWTNHTGGLGCVVLAFTSGIGTLIAWYLIPKKSSTA